MPRELTSPVGQYQPQVLVLAPENEKDPNLLSLLAQLFELGVAIELDERWRVPKAPPRDLSAYRACLFPETARARYDKDLDAFARGGGFLPYFKYYPVQNDPNVGGVHHFFQSYGRDSYFYHVANVMLEAGLKLAEPDFARTLESRADADLQTELQADLLERMSRPMERWGNWGDPGYTLVINGFAIAETARDEPLAAAMKKAMGVMADSAMSAFGERKGVELQLSEGVDAGAIMMGGLLMERGFALDDAVLKDAGAGIAKLWLDAAGDFHGAPVEHWMRLMWSECMISVPALVWLWRQTGDQAYLAQAETTVRQVAGHCQREDGLWRHWAACTAAGIRLADYGSPGTKGACWSRGTQWPVLWMTQALAALEGEAPLAALMHQYLRATYDGLQAHQDAGGMWHLVMDEPATRVESSATVALLYCHARLRELGVFDERYDAMMERAYLALKRVHYAGGLAATCRGTSTGVDTYYRTRPQGWYNCSLLPAALALRGCI